MADYYRGPREILLALEGVSPTFTMPPPEQRPGLQIEALRGLVLALLMEVEALREALIRESEREGVPPRASSYGQAYRDAALLTQNNAGLYPGWEKMLALYLGWPDEPRQQSPRGSSMRELVMMRRLGFTRDDLSAYADDVAQVDLAT